MRFAWVGSHREGIPALEALLRDGIRMEAVLTLKPEQAKKRSGGGDYHALCRRFQVPLQEIASINDAEALGLLEQLAVDVLFVIGWSQVLGPAALRSARIGVVGAHASLLPHNRGSAPVNWALIRGETEAGNTLMWLREEIDAGEIIEQTPFHLTQYDTCASVYDQVAASNREMIQRLVPRLLRGERPGYLPAYPEGPILPRRRPLDGLIAWDHGSVTIYDFVRALTRPYPGAFSYLDGRRWTIWQAARLPNGSTAAATAGTLLGPVVSPVESACGQAVACGKGTIVLLEVEAENGDVLSGRQLSDQPWEGRRWTDA